MKATTTTNPARAALDSTMDEKTFRHAVQDLLTAHCWRWVYVPDSRQVQGHPGIPDILAVRNGRLLFIELKTQRGRVRPEQHRWIVDLAVARAVNSALDVYIWRPSDMSTIERILA